MIERRPSSVREAVSMLQQLLRPDELATVKEAKCSELVRFHFNMGQYIRNLWVHRGGSPLADRIREAGGVLGEGDDFSLLVMEALWHELNQQEFNLTESTHYRRMLDKCGDCQLASVLYGAKPSVQPT